MPTGTPISDVPDQLRGAAGRVLRRDGADALTSRAVTSEAGLAKGILHRYFADFDTFLASLVVARLELIDGDGARLRAAAGSATVAGNLADALAAALDPDALGIVTLVMSRRPLLDRLRLTTPVGVPLLAELTRAIAAYLTAERGLGRLAPGVDVDRLAVALVGRAHLLLAGGEAAAVGGELRALVTAVLDEPRRRAYSR